MKKIIFSTLFVALIVSCNKDKKTTKQIEKNIIEGNWRITNFNDSGDNETSDFNNYIFTFSESGSVSATNGSNTISGTWSTNNSSSDDSNSNAHFVLNFAVAAEHPFEDLNDDWDITSESKSKIELNDVSGGNGGSDFLTFEKN